MTIVQGNLYRRKSDGAKLLALESVGDHWRFYRLGKERISTVWECPSRDVVEWREPVSKTVVGYVWLGENNSVAIEKYKCGPDRLGIEGTCTEKIIACKRFEVTVRENEYDD